MSTLLLSLLLVILIAIGLLMSKPIREHFADPSQGITDDEWDKIPQEKKRMMMSMCHFAKEAPTSPESAYMNAHCRYIKNKLSLKQEFDGYKKETIDEMHPWCDYLKANYAPTPSVAAAKPVPTPSDVLKTKQPINEELTQLQLSLERKCRQMANNTDDTITPQNRAYWSDVCASLGKVKAINSRQMDVAAQQPYDEEPRKYKKNEEDCDKETVDMSKYIKMNEIPCWNCSLP